MLFFRLLPSAQNIAGGKAFEYCYYSNSDSTRYLIRKGNVGEIKTNGLTFAEATNQAAPPSCILPGCCRHGRDVQPELLRACPVSAPGPGNRNSRSRSTGNYSHSEHGNRNSSHCSNSHPPAKRLPDTPRPYRWDRQTYAAVWFEPKLQPASHCHSAPAQSSNP